MALRRPILCLLAAIALLSCYDSHQLVEEGPPAPPTCFEACTAELDYLIYDCWDRYRDCYLECDGPLTACEIECTFEPHLHSPLDECHATLYQVIDECMGMCPCWDSYTSCIDECNMIVVPPPGCSDRCDDDYLRCSGCDMDDVRDCNEACRYQRAEDSAECPFPPVTDDRLGWINCEVNRNVSFSECCLSCF